MFFLLNFKVTTVHKAPDSKFDMHLTSLHWS